jgi:voltage-gated potassium channel
MITQLVILISKLREKLVKKALPFLVAITFLFICVSSISMYFLERNANHEMKTYLDSLWWCLVTITTVGYGDIFPVTGAGKIVAAITMTFGIGFLGIFTATIATVLIDSLLKEGRGLGSTLWRKHIVICNWNGRAHFVIKELRNEIGSKNSLIVLLANLEEKPVDEDIVFLRGNPGSEDDLKRANIAEASTAIILADDVKNDDKDNIDAKSVLSAMTIRSLNKDIHITVEVLNPQNVAHFKRAGADEIISTSEISGNLLARSALFSGMGYIVSDLLTKEYGNQIYKVDPGSKYLHKRYEDALKDILENTGAILIAVESGGEFITRPAGHTIKEGDKFFLIAKSFPKF